MAEVLEHEQDCGHCGRSVLKGTIVVRTMKDGQGRLQQTRKARRRGHCLHTSPTLSDIVM